MIATDIMNVWFMILLHRGGNVRGHHNSLWISQTIDLFRLFIPHLQVIHGYYEVLRAICFTPAGPGSA